ncbi:actin maturation protease [Atheta coriaria]|uniref:actin maturation protease n=1 Tax=Dalotia coriaria TaxID=877792 RepID=UPI0031F3E6FC
MAFTWCSDYPDLQLVCRAHGRFELSDPDRYCIKIIPSVTQQGPQCGLVALAMCTATPSKEKVAEIFTYANKEGMTNLGEMFSVDYMYSLAMRFIPESTIEIHAGSLNVPKLVDFLMSGGTLLVPYDCDKNHTPIMKGGFKAHWAIVFGIVESYAGLFVIAKQGKSLNVHIWDLEELSQSNQQLREYENEKSEFGFKYVMPEGGMGGLNGLCNRCVMIYPNETTKCYTSVGNS